MSKKEGFNPIQNLMNLSISAKHDGWLNTLTGLGVSGKDKRLGATAQWGLMGEATLEHLYASDDTAARVIDIIPEDGTREWIEFKVAENHGGKELIKKISLEFERLKVKQKVEQAWSWSRLYGGAGLFVAVDDGKELSEPLNNALIRVIRSLVVLNRFELQPQDIINNVENPMFGFPENYLISTHTGNMHSVIHHSRIIRFDGARLPRTLFISNNYWSDSVLNRLYNVIRNYNSSHDSVAATIQDFKVGILKLKDLADLVANDAQKDALKSRIEIMNLSKSVLNSIIIDADSEGYDNMTTQLTGLKDVLDVIDNRLVAATGLPHTIILGEGSTGVLSGAGESENRQYSDHVASSQEKYIADQINSIFDLIQFQKQGPTHGKKIDELTWEFKPLWQMTNKEKTDTRKTQAETDKIYFEIGALDSDEIAMSRFGGEEYSMETSIDLGAREEQQKTPTEAIGKELEDEDNAHKDILKQVEGGWVILYASGPDKGKRIPQTEKPVSYENALSIERAIQASKRKGDMVHEIDWSLEMFTRKIALDFQNEDLKRELQTIIISKERIRTKEEAEKIAEKFGDILTIRETEESFRFAQRPPEDFIKTSFKSFRPKGLNSVTLIFGTLK